MKATHPVVPWKKNDFLPARPLSSAEFGYLDEQETPVDSTESELKNLLLEGKAIWYVWTPNHDTCVPPEACAMLLPARRKLRNKTALRQMAMGLGVLAVGAVLLTVSQPGITHIATYLVMMLLGVFPLLDGLYQRWSAQRRNAAEAMEMQARLEYWMEGRASPFTKALIALIASLFVLQLLTGLDASIASLGMAGERVNDGAFWRIGTAMLLHGNIPHILFNAYAISYLSRRMELLGGWPLTAVIFTASGILGMIASYLFSDGVTLSVGASGGICGMLGWLLARTFLSRPDLTFAFAWPLLLGIFSLIALGMLLPNIDNIGHGAGFLAGLGLALIPGTALGYPHTSSRSLRIAGMLAVLLLLGLSATIAWTLLLG